MGINVPIHTVVLTQLTKFDGTKMRRLRSREFHQIVGRAGRAGFDTEGMAIALAPEHEIENHKALLKAGDDPKKQRCVKKKQPPEGFVSWNKQTFEHLIEKPPEKLTPRMRITHSMVLSVVSRGGDAWANVHQLIADSAQTPEEKIKLNARADEIFGTLLEAGVVVRETDAEGNPSYVLTVDLPEDFALDQPLSPFLLAALDLLDPESDTYALDVISLVEATLENPAKVLRAQERKARDAAMAAMKADGVEYEDAWSGWPRSPIPSPWRSCWTAPSSCTARACPGPATTSPSTTRSAWTVTRGRPPTSPSTRAPKPNSTSGMCARSSWARTPTATSASRLT